MKFRSLFPLLKNNPDLIYFDTAATALKPKTVIDAEVRFLNYNGTNPHNTSFVEAQKANEILENSRLRVAQFIHAPKIEEVIFTSGTTESLNQIAFGLSSKIKKDDEIFLTYLEHASNFLPWMTVANHKKAQIKMMPLTDNYQIDEKKLIKLLSSKTKIVSFASASNTMGVFNQIPHLTKIIRKYAPQAIIVIDAAQSIAHFPTNVEEWDIDFLAFSLHKMFGPFGLGVLWGKNEYLEKMTPLIYGGGMLQGVSKDLKHFNSSKLPSRLEAGTPNIQAISAVEPAIDIIESFGWKKIIAYENELQKYLRNQIKAHHLTKEFDFYNLNLEANTLIFNSKQWPTHEVANWLGYKHHIAVRGGVHCAWLTDRLLGVKASVRLSLGLYNTKSEIDQFIETLKLIDHEMPKFIFEGK